MAAKHKPTSNKPTSLLGRLRTAVKKVTFLMNFSINRWQLVSSIIGRGGRTRALSSRPHSFNERLGLTSIISSPSDQDDHSNWVTPFMTPNSRMSPDQGELQKTRSFPLQRTTSFPQEDDIDKRADLFISNFYRQLKMERQVSLQLSSGCRSSDYFDDQDD
ncbi:hypothetical protein E3N88_35966 [Mikania micrantha]|uniref:Uncharacterized protein n=1 Tax=Mikania micrantha TaxID=192012 RepID=A0A5N6M3E1_9ASTR|nr:hypothetical protein E3N88_35966 [Mikania micrantha]